MAIRNFDYFFRGHPQVVSELNKLGIKLVTAEVWPNDPAALWPGLQLPSGHILAIAQDDEGNGPGAIHIFTPEPPNPKG